MADSANENASSDPAYDSEFVAVVRTAMHDFNNVLMSMMGWAELGQTLDNLDERATGYLKDIFEAGKRGQELVQGVQDKLMEMGGSEDDAALHEVPATQSTSSNTSVSRDASQADRGADPAPDNT